MAAVLQNIPVMKKLTDWTVSLAARESAQYWLAFVAFIESFVFPIPTDGLYIPMAMVKRDRAYRYALIATVFSVFGGIAGWLIGHFAYATIAKPVLEFYGKIGTFEALRQSADFKLIAFLLITSGLVHLPPIKLVTLLAGALSVNIWVFIGLAVVTRGARFYVFAWLIQRHGPAILHFVVRRFKWVAGFAVIACLAGYLLYRFAF